MTNEVDLRGFNYPLEPLLKRQQWNLDALQLKLGRLEKAAGAATVSRTVTQAAYDEHARDVRKGPGVALEPAAYGRTLAHLAGLQAEIARLNLRLEELRQERRALQAEYLSTQVKMNIAKTHKQECLLDYAASQQNRLDSERDREWLARAAHARTGSGA
jgi:hypothetical protein